MLHIKKYERSSGHGSLVVKATDSWLVYYEFEPSTAEDPPCRVAMHIKSVVDQSLSVGKRCALCRDLKRPPAGVVVKRVCATLVVDLVT
ncbi:hypothetical protein TNCV_5006391 [Trichonephila clavipes]|uniref:Uncharacterized protein n=1 Tax=Trichonephila clavipes TaxID=2585209 RepID=A0A8X6S911_TRICX|nr:hypothetical protein TNCV_5006391 [Trichonephila clavipes]